MIGKFLFKVIGMSEEADLIVNVLTDWPAIKVGAYVAISAAALSAIGTVAGVYLGIKLSLKSFYSQKWWERRADAYIQVLQDLEKVFRSAVSIIGFHKEGGTDLSALKLLEVNFKESLDALQHARFINSIFYDKDTNDTLNSILNRSIIENGVNHGTREHMIETFEQLSGRVGSAKIKIESNMHENLLINKNNH